MKRARPVQATLNLHAEALGKPGSHVRLNAKWRKNHGLLAVKYVAWGDDKPATGDEGVVTAHCPDGWLWVRFEGELISRRVEYDECEVMLE